MPGGGDQVLPVAAAGWVTDDPAAPTTLAAEHLIYSSAHPPTHACYPHCTDGKPEAGSCFRSQVAGPGLEF